jgi:hypothetical protein
VRHARAEAGRTVERDECSGANTQVRAGLARQAGSAVTWKAAQQAGTKVIFLARTLILARLL